MTQAKRYTLPLPEALYNEISKIADENGKTMKDVLQQCLRFGLTAMKIAADPNAEIIFREKLPQKDENGNSVIRESLVKFVW